MDFVKDSKQSTVLWLHFTSFAIHALNVLPLGERFYCTFLSSIPCAAYHLMLFLLLEPQTALTSEIATSSKVIRVLPELLRARVMTWP